MAKEAYVTCPISGESVLFEQFGAPVGDMRCATPEKLYCKNPTCDRTPKKEEQGYKVSLASFGGLFELQQIICQMEHNGDQ